MSNTAENWPIFVDSENDGLKPEKPNLKVVESKESSIENSLKVLVSKLREYTEVINEILYKDGGKTEELAKKVESYAITLEEKGYISGSSFEHIINTLSVELCPCAKHFVNNKGSEHDRDVIIKSFEAMNDYIDLLLKYKSFEDEELKSSFISSESVVQYIEKRKESLTSKEK